MDADGLDLEQDHLPPQPASTQPETTRPGRRWRRTLLVIELVIFLAVAVWVETRWWAYNSVLAAGILVAARIVAWGFVIALAAAIPHRRVWRVGVLGVACAAAAIVIATGWLSSDRGSLEWFEEHRAEFETARGLALPADAYSTLLPADLAHLSKDGTVRTGSGPDGQTIFFPQWFGIPDDAGGYIYSPGGDPTGFDMYGMSCQGPVDLGDGWWSCGM